LRGGTTGDEKQERGTGKYPTNIKKKRPDAIIPTASEKEKRKKTER